MKWVKSVCCPVATQVFNAVNQRRQTMPEGTDITAANLVGDTVWKSLSSDQKRFAGRFISVCVRRGMLGLEQIRRSSSNHWLYVVA